MQRCCIVVIGFNNKRGGKMDKVELRKNTIHTLKNVSKKEHKHIEEQLQETVFQTELWKNSQTVGITISQDGIEWDTKQIIEQGWRDGKKIAVPKCFHENRSMIFYEFQSYDELEVVYFNLKEPIPNEERIVPKNNLDILFVPGVVFDSSGYRIGFGGGYYDRFLMDYKHVTLSFVSEKQLISRIPKESHDIPVDYLVTEKGLIETSRG